MDDAAPDRTMDDHGQVVGPSFPAIVTDARLDSLVGLSMPLLEKNNQKQENWNIAGRLVTDQSVEGKKPRTRTSSKILDENNQKIPSLTKVKVSRFIEAVVPYT